MSRNKYNIGDIFKDMKLISYEKGKYTLQCLKCNRIKIVTIGCMSEKKGLTHSACGQNLKTKDKRFHKIWQGLRHRTTCETAKNYKWYGGRGIKSNAFENFIDFYDTMYESYLKHCELHGEDNTTLDRINVDGNYEPNNCEWVTWEYQKENTTKARSFKAISPDGKEFYSKNQCKFAREHNLSDKQINACLSGRFKTHLGWKFEYID